MTCVCCGDELNMATAVRIEMNGPEMFVVQFVCPSCGRKLARSVVPRADRPLATRAVA